MFGRQKKSDADDVSAESKETNALDSSRPDGDAEDSSLRDADVNNDDVAKLDAAPLDVDRQGSADEADSDLSTSYDGNGDGVDAGNDDGADGGGMDAEAEMRAAIEAICLVSDQPVPASLLSEVLELSVAKVDELCAELASQYESQDRGFVLANVAGGWRFQSHPTMATYVEKFVLDGQSARLSGAALETLAIVAYKQPMSRAQIAAIRGVNVDGVLKTLQQRGYVTELGHDPGPGQAILFGTTPLFLEKLGIASLADLPPLGDFIPDAQLVEALEQGLRPGATIDVRSEADSVDVDSE